MCDRCNLLDRHNRLLLALCYSADTRSSGRNASGSSCGSSSLYSLVFVALRVKGAQPQSLCDTKHQERVSVLAQQHNAYTQPRALTTHLFTWCHVWRLCWPSTANTCPAANSMTTHATNERKRERWECVSQVVVLCHQQHSPDAPGSAPGGSKGGGIVVLGARHHGC